MPESKKSDSHLILLTLLCPLALGGCVTVNTIDGVPTTDREILAIKEAQFAGAATGALLGAALAGGRGSAAGYREKQLAMIAGAAGGVAGYQQGSQRGVQVVTNHRGEKFRVDRLRSAVATAKTYNAHVGAYNERLNRKAAEVEKMKSTAESNAGIGSDRENTEVRPMGVPAQGASAGYYPVKPRIALASPEPADSFRIFQTTLSKATSHNRKIRRFNENLSRKAAASAKAKALATARAELAQAAGIKAGISRRIKLRENLVKNLPSGYQASYQATIAALKKEESNLERTMEKLREIVKPANRTSLAAAESAKVKED